MPAAPLFAHVPTQTTPHHPNQKPPERRPHPVVQLGEPFHHVAAVVEQHLPRPNAQHVFAVPQLGLRRRQPAAQHLRRRGQQPARLPVAQALAPQEAQGIAGGGGACERREAGGVGGLARCWWGKGAARGPRCICLQEVEGW